jgi:uncharacterized membrane protein
MKSTVLSLVVLAALAGALPAHAQQIVMLANGTWANDVTPDGEVVVGTAPGGGFIWRWRVDPAPTMVPGGDMVGVSDDGTVVAGTIIVDSKEHAAIWTAATGWQSLGGLESCDFFLSSAYDISGDGTTIVGLAWQSCHGLGFRWTAATGLEPLQNLANGNNRCSAISGDGTDLGGFAQGTFTRTPAYWIPGKSGMVLNPNFRGEVFGFNEDGNLSVGTNLFSGAADYSAFVRNKQSGVMTNLGHLNPGWDGNATDISEDASLIVGYDVLVFAREAWLWTAPTGIVSLNAKLTALGVTGAPPLQVCRACSDDGTVIVGGAQGQPAGYAGFIVDLAPSTWTNLGQGLAGISGVPELAGTGTLAPASPTVVALSNAKPNGSATLIVGLSAIDAPFKGGVLVPQPTFLVGALPIDAAGAMNLPFPWPAGLPSGFSLFWQAWIGDAAAPKGFAASNALESTTP